MKIIACAECQMEFGMPDAFHLTMKQGHYTFYCPAGHSNYYPKGETEADKLRRERDRLAQNAAYLEERIKSLADQRDHAERRVSAVKGQVTKLKKRAAAGVCTWPGSTLASFPSRLPTSR
jgi:hypothetical protein